MKAIGWAVLAEISGREIVFGAVTQPWVANPVFRAIPPDEFAAFHEPGYVKIAWTLPVESRDAATSLAQTETRASATDVLAHTQFRRYWSFVWPGVVLIRFALFATTPRHLSLGWFASRSSSEATRTRAVLQSPLQVIENEPVAGLSCFHQPNPNLLRRPFKVRATGLSLHMANQRLGLG